jgi:hypothetical protein
MTMRTLTVASATLLLIGATALPTEAQARYYYHGHHHGNGGAVAAGVLGGLAVGALAAGAARPYGYGYPARGYGYGYGDPGYGYGGCYVTRQRVIDDWSYPHWRRVRVCD